MKITNTITKDELITSLSLENGKFFNITNIDEYASKVLSLGKIISLKKENKVISYIIYYDNDIPYITMVWVDPNHRRKGLSKKLLSFLQNKYNHIRLEVNVKSPAKKLYESFNFKDIEINKDQVIQEWKKSIAVMQPYVYPYQGYFNLIESADHIVFYDDVNFIKGGYINRNSILCNNKPHVFSINLKNQSSNKLIKEIYISEVFKYHRLLKTIKQSYKNAPYFTDVFEMLNYSLETESISNFAIESIKNVYSYLGKKLNYSLSSEVHSESKGLEKTQRLLSVIKRNNNKRYINTSGGKDLYQKADFLEHNIELNFCTPIIKEYSQFNKRFIPNLSIIDVLMFNTVKDCYKIFESYKLD